MSVTDYSGLSKVAPEKSLLAPLGNKSGRNSYGRITVRHRGGGNRKKYRIIDHIYDQIQDKKLFEPYFKEIQNFINKEKEE